MLAPRLFFVQTDESASALVARPPPRVTMPRMSAEQSSRPKIGIPRPKTQWVRHMVDAPLRLAERAFGLDRIDAMSREVWEGDPAVSVHERILRATGLDLQIAPGELERVPRSGPVVVCANHPYGGADGVAMLVTMLRHRPDTKVLSNGVLSRFPFIADKLILVDPFGGADAARRNAKSLREALDWLKAGHLVACFPAGEVAAVHWGDWNPTDPPWSTIPARLALKSGAKVVPSWFEGTNRPMFHAAGLIHPRLRTALLPNEFIARCNTAVEMRFGRAIPTEGSGTDAESLTRLVRGRSELLRRAAPVPVRAPQESQPIAAPAATGEELTAEFASLPPDALLLREGDYDVLAVRSTRIPKAMHEIGRLREIAFRAVGEGSGTPFDVDRFDEHYHQLIVWNRARREIVGGYRAGVVAELVQSAVAAGQPGVEGLYTSTLFEFSPRLVEELGDAVELGRSYVRVEYQRQPLPLSLLWKGIGAFMMARGRSRMFGPVSISNDYNSMSKELIMEFLERHRLSTPFAKLVTPRNPPERRGIACWTDRERAEATADLLHVERLLEEIERGQRAVPVLLRQYLRLNARLLAFNVDPDFGEVIDALMLVDLTQIDERIVRHYVGDGAYETLQASLAARGGAR